jgi:hypothetical protein
MSCNAHYLFLNSVVKHAVGLRLAVPEISAIFLQGHRQLPTGIFARHSFELNMMALNSCDFACNLTYS